IVPVNLLAVDTTLGCCITIFAKGLYCRDSIEGDLLCPSLRVFQCLRHSYCRLPCHHLASWLREPPTDGYGLAPAEKMSGVSSGTSIKKKRRKWEGLKQDEAFTADVGHGPITALTFIRPRTLFTSTLMRKVTLHEINGSIADGKLDISPKWTRATTNVNKVNAIIGTGDLIIVGGLSEREGGTIEVWEKGLNSGDV
ncbi:hypothetical protein BDR03DRAFT_281200, partial [Suillus americanus]